MVADDPARRARRAGLIKSRPLDRWRETLAALTAYCGAEEWPGLCDALARRLAAAGLPHAATLVWVCAGNVDRAVRQWSADARAGGLTTPALRALVERALVLGLGARQAQAAPALADLVAQYAGLLASQARRPGRARPAPAARAGAPAQRLRPRRARAAAGAAPRAPRLQPAGGLNPTVTLLRGGQGRLAAALEYLDLVPGEATSATAELRDRICRSGAPGLPPGAGPPPFPFIAEEVAGGGGAFGGGGGAPAYGGGGAPAYEQPQAQAPGARRAPAAPVRTGVRAGCGPGARCACRSGRPACAGRHAGSTAVLD